MTSGPGLIEAVFDPADDMAFAARDEVEAHAVHWSMLRSPNGEQSQVTRSIGAYLSARVDIVSSVWAVVMTGASHCCGVLATL